MMMNKRRPLIFAVSLLLTTLACAIPGQQAASVPTPTVDAALLDAIVAETVSAVLQQTALAPTAVPAATATPPATPSATSTPLQQSSITIQADGTTFFADEKAGFNLTIPPGWLGVRIDQIEYYDAFSLPQAADPLVQTALMDINDMDPQRNRLFIFDLQDGHLQSGFINNVEVVWGTAPLSLKTDDEIEVLAASLPFAVPGLVVQSFSVTETASNIQIGIIVSEIDSQKEDGTELVLFQKHVFINVKSGKVVLIFTTEQGIKDATLPFFDSMIESIQLGE
jgi:hypothetical protein